MKNSLLGSIALIVGISFFCHGSQSLLKTNNEYLHKNKEELCKHFQSFGMDEKESHSLWSQTRKLRHSFLCNLPHLYRDSPFLCAHSIWRAYSYYKKALEFISHSVVIYRRMPSGEIEKKKAATGKISLNEEDPNANEKYLNLLAIYLTCSMSSYAKINGGKVPLLAAARSKEKLTILDELHYLLHSNPFLQKIMLYNTEINNIEPFWRNHQLRKLIIKEKGISVKKAQGPVGSLTDEHLLKLSNNPRMKDLRIIHNKLTSKAATAFLLFTLKTLYLRDNPIGNNGAIILATHPTIHTLSLQDCGIGDAGATALATSPRLRRLYLNYNSISNEGALAFLKNQRLLALGISHNNIDRELCFYLEHLLGSNNSYFNFITPPLKEAHNPGLLIKKPLVRILAIDAGAIQGIIPAKILQYITQEITQKYGRAFHIAKHLDLIVGTSLSSFLALGLAAGAEGKPRYTCNTLVNYYLHECPSLIEMSPHNITTKEPKKRQSDIEAWYGQKLKEYFDESELASCICPVVIPAIDSTTGKVILMSNAHLPEAQHDYKIRDAIKAASACPFYFDPVSISKTRGHENLKCIDAGFYSYNATLLALQCAINLFPHAKQIEIISLGTDNVKDNETVYPYFAHSVPNIKQFIEPNLRTGMIKEKITSLRKRLGDILTFTRIQPVVTDEQEDLNDMSPLGISQKLEKIAQDTIQAHESSLNGLIAQLSKEFLEQIALTKKKLLAGEIPINPSQATVSMGSQAKQ